MSLPPGLISAWHGEDGFWDMADAVDPSDPTDRRPPAPLLGGGAHQACCMLCRAEVGAAVNLTTCKPILLDEDHGSGPGWTAPAGRAFRVPSHRSYVEHGCIRTVAR